MRLYLVRHGAAKPKEADPERPLTDKGVEVARRVATFLKGNGQVSVEEIRHSTKARARQTAEVLAEQAGLSGRLVEVSDLEPLDDVFGLAGTLFRLEADLMVVGHMPYLDRLASLLVTGDAERRAFPFPECGVLCLQREEAGVVVGAGVAWAVRWMLDPRLLHA